MITAPTGDIFNPANGPLANYLNKGDSGSPLFAYDSHGQKMGFSWRSVIRKRAW